MSEPSTTTSSTPAESDPGRGKFGDVWLIAPVLVVVILAAIFYFTDRQAGMELSGGVKPGESFPEIQADAWLNGEPPTKAELAGKIVVVEVWASWCEPCRRIAPKMMEMYEAYHAKGVVFIGMTTQEKEELQDIEDFIKEFGIPWPNGYGAHKFMEATKAEAIPAIWVIGADGKVLWNRDGMEAPEKSIDAELARLAGKPS